MSPRVAWRYEGPSLAKRAQRHAFSADCLRFPRCLAQSCAPAMFHISLHDHHDAAAMHLILIVPPSCYSLGLVLSPSLAIRRSAFTGVMLGELDNNESRKWCRKRADGKLPARVRAEWRHWECCARRDLSNSTAKCSGAESSSSAFCLPRSFASHLCSLTIALLSSC